MNTYERNGCVIEINIEHDRLEEDKLFSLIDQGYIQEGVNYKIFVRNNNLLFGSIEVNKDIVPKRDLLVLKPYNKLNMDKKILRLLKFINDVLGLDLPYAGEEEIVQTQKFWRVSAVYSSKGDELLSEEMAEMTLLEDILSGGIKND